MYGPEGDQSRSSAEQGDATARLMSRALRLGVLGVILLAACTSASGGPSADEPTATLRDLQGLDEFKSLFNEDKGTPRLVLLMSPT